MRGESHAFFVSACADGQSVLGAVHVVTALTRSVSLHFGFEFYTL